MTESIGTAHEPENPLILAQLEQLRLTNEKLKLEIDQLKKPGRSQPSLLQFLPVVTALVAVSGFLWGVAQYVREAERQSMKPWLEGQRDTYLQALSFAATAANAQTPEEGQKATYEFWRLYQGKMILVETKSVSDAMVAFGRCLEPNPVCDRDKMNELAQNLASRMAESMAATAKMTYREFSANQFKYAAKE